MKTKLLFALVILTMLFTLTKAYSQPILLTPAPIDDTAPGSGGSGYAGVNGAYYTTNPYYADHHMDFILWEGENATQDQVWKDFTATGLSASVYLNSGNYFYYGQEVHPNDEARSISIQGAPAGKVIELYDSPSFDTADDWCQITVKQNMPDTSMYVVFNLEGTYEDAYVKVVYHHYNGLNGKVSSYKVY